MTVDVLTKSDLTQFKSELLEELRSILNIEQPKSNPWIKSSEVRKLLGCSHGTLQNLRANGTLTPSKIGGTYYYQYQQVESLLSSAA